jgi:deubiquitinase DESI2
MPSSSSKPPPARPKRSRTSSSMSQTLQKTEITINVYDLLPVPSRIGSLLWTFGSSLLHSGVVINNREYAYGGHNKRNTTGVYYTKPRFEPPGGTYRCSILQGFTYRTQAEIDDVVKKVSDEFLGERYNLLTNNCNHFTSALCERLTGKPAPGWLNRAASIGLALPCVVPREWVNPPDHETVEGALLDEEEEDGEAAAMLASDRRRRQREAQRRAQAEGVVKEEEGEDAGASLAGGKKLSAKPEPPPARLVSVKDTSGREMPVAERAPVPKR